ncbi:hypothetical protein D1872_346860 [compost metagenome]
MSRATITACSKSSIRPSDPGMTGTFASFIVCLATALSPILVMASGEGPMKVILHEPQISAKSAFSARKP